MAIKKRTAVILKWAGIVVVTLGVLYAILLITANRKLSRAYAALEEAGRPMNVSRLDLSDFPNGWKLKAQLVVPPSVPDQDNAALLYQAAVLKLKSGVGSNEENLYQRLRAISSVILRGYPPPTQSDWDTFRRLIEDPLYADTLALWESGLDKPHCRYDRDYSAGPDIRYAGIDEHQILFQIFCVAALIKAQDGDSAGAWRLIEKLFRFADDLKTGPSLIDQLSRIGLFSAGEKTMRQIAAISLPDEETLAALEQQLRVFENIELFILAMDGERLMKGEWVFDFASKQSPIERIRWFKQISSRYNNRGAPSLLQSGLLIVLGRPILRLDHAKYLEIMAAQTRMSSMQYWPKKDTQGEEMLNRIPSYYVLTEMLVPRRINRERYVCLTVQATVARTGLAVLRYYQQNDQFPETLSTTGQTFTDWFSGKEIVYQQNDTGFIVYSIGPNQVDDGGREKPEYTGDIVWKWEKL